MMVEGAPIVEVVIAQQVQVLSSGNGILETHVVS
jgi:hypothetical protein